MPEIELDIKSKHVLSSIGIPLEVLRNKILELSNNNLFYPVNPTSRNDAFVGGTLSCNASGFIPGDKGATRYWVKEIEFLLPNGNYLSIKRGQYISVKSKFFLEDKNNIIELPVPTYKRPKIKNASGPFSSNDGDIVYTIRRVLLCVNVCGCLWLVVVVCCGVLLFVVVGCCLLFVVVVVCCLLWLFSVVCRGSCLSFVVAVGDNIGFGVGFFVHLVRRAMFLAVLVAVPQGVSTSGIKRYFHWIFFTITSFGRFF